MIEIAPSILSANFVDLKNEIEPIKDEINYIHLDVMDGHFVPNITLGPPVVKSLTKTLSPLKNFIFDTHLMIENPDFFIKDFVNAGSNLITIHQEATKHLDRSLQLIKSFNVKAGVALNPATPIETLEYVLYNVDLILIMTVNPGFGGQSFIKGMLNKIEKTKKMIESVKKDILIQVDGGVCAENIKDIYNAGANVFVAGSSVFNSPDRVKAIKEMKSKTNII